MTCTAGSTASCRLAQQPRRTELLLPDVCSDCQLQSQCTVNPQNSLVFVMFILMVVLLLCSHLPKKLSSLSVQLCVCYSVYSKVVYTFCEFLGYETIVVGGGLKFLPDSLDVSTEILTSLVEFCIVCVVLGTVWALRNVSSFCYFFTNNYKRNNNIARICNVYTVNKHCCRWVWPTRYAPVRLQRSKVTSFDRLTLKLISTLVVVLRLFFHAVRQVDGKDLLG